jgi:Tol biopolymer transport system component
MVARFDPDRHRQGETPRLRTQCHGRRVRTARSRTIYRGGSSPQWSPTGRSIAFAAERPATTGGIYLVRRDGSHLRLLVPFLGYPHFSPDGTRVATLAGGFEGTVFVVNADGSHLRQWTQPFDDTRAVGSPDHQKIAFVRSFPLDARTGTPEPRPRTVYVIDGDGTRLRRIALGDSVAWAPDSAQVTFSRDGDIYSAPVAGGAATQLTSGSDDDSTPAWSPNGRDDRLHPRSFGFGAGHLPRRRLSTRPSGLPVRGRWRSGLVAGRDLDLVHGR